MNWRGLIEQLSVAGLDAESDIEVSAATGGDINRAFRLVAGEHRFFVKLNRAELLPMFEAERAGLEAMRNTRAIRVPEVYATGCHGDQACIVMEYIELSGQADAERLAAALAAMHECRAESFGFHLDNTIGSTPQINRGCDDWIEFWRQNRLGFQLQLAEQRGFDSSLIDAGARLNEVIGRFFETYRPFASLLHGDLWSGNRAADSNGAPVIYDPACYYGDHEADLAMMELFGHPGERFFAAYRERFPIDAGYAERRDLYNLYHLFNHALLFGGGYLAQTRHGMERLLALT
jgi:protein-ribulosamine 3-kinase